MNSRRLTGQAPQQRVLPYHAVGCIVHHGKFWLPMSALGQKQTSAYVRFTPRKRTLVERVGMSALCQKRTHAVHPHGSLFDHLVGAGQQSRGDVEAKLFGGLEIDDKFEFRGLHNWHFCRLLSLQNTASVDTSLVILID